MILMALAGCTTLQKPVSVVPIDQMATITFETTPIEATVFIDGFAFGQTPVTLAIAAGYHKLILQRKGYEKYLVNLEVVAGETKVITRRLRLGE